MLITKAVIGWKPSEKQVEHPSKNWTCISLIGQGGKLPLHLWHPTQPRCKCYVSTKNVAQPSNETCTIPKPELSWCLPNRPWRNATPLHHPTSTHHHCSPSEITHRRVTHSSPHKRWRGKRLTSWWSGERKQFKQLLTFACLVVFLSVSLSLILCLYSIQYVSFEFSVHVSDQCCEWLQSRGVVLSIIHMIIYTIRRTVSCTLWTGNCIDIDVDTPNWHFLWPYVCNPHTHNWCILMCVGECRVAEGSEGRTHWTIQECFLELGSATGHLIWAGSCSTNWDQRRTLIHIVGQVGSSRTCKLYIERVLEAFLGNDSVDLLSVNAVINTSRVTTDWIMISCVYSLPPDFGSISVTGKCPGDPSPQCLGTRLVHVWKLRLGAPYLYNWAIYIDIMPLHQPG